MNTIWMFYRNQVRGGSHFYQRNHRISSEFQNFVHRCADSPAVLYVLQGKHSVCLADWIFLWKIKQCFWDIKLFTAGILFEAMNQIGRFMWHAKLALQMNRNDCKESVSNNNEIPQRFFLTILLINQSFYATGRTSGQKSQQKSVILHLSEWNKMIKLSYTY